MLFGGALACLWQNDFSLSRPSSRADGSNANVIRNQFFNPTVTPMPPSTRWEGESLKFNYQGILKL